MLIASVFNQCPCELNRPQFTNGSPGSLLMYLVHLVIKIYNEFMLIERDRYEIMDDIH